MNFIKKYFLWFILIIVLALLGYIQTLKKSPCEAPITYTLGTFDARFNISKTDFIREVENATHIWENSIGKDFFEKADSAKPVSDSFKNSNSFKKLKNIVQDYLQKYIGRYFTRKPIIINLIYDSRQKIADQQRVVISEIDDTKQSADEIKQQFLTLQGDYENAKVEYQTLLNEYKNKHEDWNILEAKRLEVNGLADEINILVKKYNFLVLKKLV